MNDQSEMDIKDFDWFSSIFKNIIRDIRQVLLVLSPWDDPMPIKRECCLFQIHNALQQESSCMSLCVKLRSSGVMEGSKCVIQSLSDTQAEKAEAKTVSDRNMIFEVLM